MKETINIRVQRYLKPTTHYFVLIVLEAILCLHRYMPTRNFKDTITSELINMSNSSGTLEITIWIPQDMTIF